MLYNDQIDHDILNILEHIDGFTVAIGVDKTPVDTAKLINTTLRMRQDFPCKDGVDKIDGVDKASIFKQAAVFVACFVEEGPIDSQSFVQSKLKPNIKDKNPNAIIALDIAFKFMSLARVKRTDGVHLTINNGIILSNHSYCDFLDMLSKGITLKDHFMALSLLFEQIVYKTHRAMQYDELNFAQETQKELENPLYPSTVQSNRNFSNQRTSSSNTQSAIQPKDGGPGWDDYIGFWSDLK